MPKKWVYNYRWQLGSYDRLNKVLTFWKPRFKLYNSQPILVLLFVNWTKDWMMPDEATIDVVDSGRLLVALNNLRIITLTGRSESIT